MKKILGKIFKALSILLLALMHILLPAVSALTAVTVLLRCFSSFRMFLANNRRRPVFIFSQANERSLHLAESLAGRKCDIVFADSSADDVNSENDARRGYIFKEEEISQIGVRSKGKKDIYFFCIYSFKN